MQYKEFDEKIKSMLVDAEEDVPSGVWESVSAELDRIARRRRTIVLWRRVGAGFAVAASLALVAVFGFRQTGDESTVEVLSNGKLVSLGDVEPIAVPVEVAPVDEVPDILASTQTFVPKSIASTPVVAQPSSASAPVADAQPSSTAGIAGHSDFVSDAQSSSTVGTTDHSDSVSDADAQPSGKASDVSPSAPAPDYAADDALLAELAYSQNKQRSRASKFSADASGSLAGNDYRYREVQSPGFKKSPSSLPRPGITEISKGSLYKVPVSFGLGVRYSFNDWLSIGTGLNLNLLDRTFTGTYREVDENGAELSAITTDMDNHQVYLGIPVSLYVNVLKSGRFGLYFYGGGEIEKCLLNSYKIPFNDNVIKYVNNPDGFQTSIFVGFGTSYSLGHGLSLFFDPSVRYFFDNNQPKSIRTQQPLGVNIELGARFDF